MRKVLDGHLYIVESFNITGKTAYKPQRHSTGSKRDARLIAKKCLVDGASHVNISVRIEIWLKGKLV